MFLYTVFYHFHYVRFYKNNLLDLGWFSLPKNTVKKLYVSYIKQLDSAAGKINEIDSSYSENLRPFSLLESASIKDRLKILIKLVTKKNLYKKYKFISH